MLTSERIGLLNVAYGRFRFDHFDELHRDVSQAHLIKISAK